MDRRLHPSEQLRRDCRLLGLSVTYGREHWRVAYMLPRGATTWAVRDRVAETAEYVRGGPDWDWSRSEVLRRASVMHAWLHLTCPAEDPLQACLVVIP